MVIGIGEGKISIVLEKTNFSPGDIIEGKIFLQLSKPIRARSLEVALVEDKIIDKHRYGEDRTVVYPRQKLEGLLLNNEYEYSDSDYYFKLKIRDDIIKTIYKGKRQLNMDEIPEGFKKKLLVKMINFKTAEIEKRKAKGLEDKVHRKWFVEATLNIPKAIDLTNAVEIKISE